MANGIELVMSVASLALGIMLAIIVSLRWYHERNRENELKDMKKGIEELRKKESTSSQQLDRLREESIETDEEIADGLKEIQAMMNEIREELAIIRTRQEETAVDIDGIEKKVLAIGQNLHTVEAIAREARKYSHEHAILGSPV